MAEFHGSGVQPYNEQNNIPNHMIIWLDKHIGRPDACVLLKSSFVLAMNPNDDSFDRALNPDDIDRSICTSVSLIVRLDQVEFLFQAFDDIEKCYEAIEENRNKRIFFITSASKGKIIVPSLVQLHPEIFPKKNPIFIFCSNLLMEPVNGVEPKNLWLLEFTENILAFDHEDNLLARMLGEISKYFGEEVNRLDGEGKLDQAGRYRTWSQQMLKRQKDLLKKIDN